MEIEKELAAYTANLMQALDQTARAEDRNRYVQHLAAAATMFEAVHRKDMDALVDRVAGEQRAFGWGYLSGPEGAAAEACFARLAELVKGVIDGY